MNSNDELMVEEGSGLTKVHFGPELGEVVA